MSRLDGRREQEASYIGLSFEVVSSGRIAISSPEVRFAW